MRPHPEVLVPEQRLVLTETTPLARRWGAYLAGGAGLALQLGHRRSRDFDWFTKETLPPDDLVRDLAHTGLSVNVRQNTTGTFHAEVGGVEYSLFRYRYDLVRPLIEFQSCHLASLHDICAMKLAAIHQRSPFPPRTFDARPGSPGLASEVPILRPVVRAERDGLLQRRRQAAHAGHAHRAHLGSGQARPHLRAGARPRARSRALTPTKAPPPASRVDLASNCFLSGPLRSRPRSCWTSKTGL